MTKKQKALKYLEDGGMGYIEGWVRRYGDHHAVLEVEVFFSDEQIENETFEPGSNDEGGCTSWVCCAWSGVYERFKEFMQEEV